MMFKFTKLMAVAALAGMPVMAVHAEKTITFTGTVIDTACVVTVNGGNTTLELGTTAAADLAEAGKIGAPKEFLVVLSDCPAPADGIPTAATITFDGETDGNTSWFKNGSTVNPATNVGVEIKDADGQAIVDGAKNTPIALPASGEKSLTYTASLVATAAGATKGSVSSALTYTVGYQ